MKRLSQAWKQKKPSSRGVENIPPNGDDDHGGVSFVRKKSDVSTAAGSLTNNEPQSKVGVSPQAAGPISQPGSFNLSFGFEFDAAALSEMDKMEKSLLHRPANTDTDSQILSPINKLQRVQDASPLQVDRGVFSFFNISPTGALHSVQRDVPYRVVCHGRISTPIEDSSHVLQSPSVQLPALSPVNSAWDSKEGVFGGAEMPGNSCFVRNLPSKNSSKTDSAHSIVECEGSTPNAVDLTSWGLPPSILQAYHSAGITHMFEWQAECLRTGSVLQGGNLVYSAPTSAGKTMVAELLMLKRVLETKRKALLILPFVSVAREKTFYLQRLFQEAGVRVGGYMGSHAPAGGFASVDVAVCTIEKANSLLNRLMEEKKVSSLGIVVVDELHLIGDSHRGYLLELFLTKVRYLSGCAAVRENGNKNDAPAIQIVGMSATLPNLDMLAKWLAADLYFTDYRPVPLTEMIKVGTTIYDSGMRKIRDLESAVLISGDSDHVIPLCKETVAEGHSVLVFCPTKSWCEKLSETIAKHFAQVGSAGMVTRSSAGQRNEATGSVKTSTAGQASAGSGFVKASSLVRFDYAALQEVMEQLRRTPVGLDTALAKSVPHAVAFHHAGLTFDERDIIEGAFREGAIRVLVATSTLSSGVNLPARRVIIRTPIFHGKLVDPLVYKQMAGRAGRKGVDSLGESVLICKPSERQKGANLLNCQLKAVESCLMAKEDNVSIQRALLEVIASGVAPRPRDVERYAACTFYASSVEQKEGEAGTELVINSTIKFLVENEFVRLQSCRRQDGEKDGTPEGRYIPSQLGVATLASALCPREALVVFAELQRARKCFVLESELHVIYQVTPIYLQDQWPNLDWYQYLRIWESLPSHMRRVADMVGVEEAFLARAVRGRLPKRNEQQRRALAVHRRFFAALALQDLVHEVSLHVVAGRYGATKGMLQSLQSSAATFAGMVTVFCQKLGWTNLELLLSQFQSRLTFGVQRELCDLVRISLLNATRARMLYTAGYHTVGALASASPGEIENILRNAAPFVSGRRRNGETEYEVRERCEARVIWVAGRRGLTESVASRLIVEEAKELLQCDVAQLGIQWKPPDIRPGENRAEVEKAPAQARNSLAEVGTGDPCNAPEGNALFTRNFGPSGEPEQLRVTGKPGKRQHISCRSSRAFGCGDGERGDAISPIKLPAQVSTAKQKTGATANYETGEKPQVRIHRVDVEADAVNTKRGGTMPDKRCKSTEKSGKGSDKLSVETVEQEKKVEQIEIEQQTESTRRCQALRENQIRTLEVVRNMRRAENITPGVCDVPAVSSPIPSLTCRGANSFRPKTKRRSPSADSADDSDESERPKFPRKAEATPEMFFVAECTTPPETYRSHDEDQVSAHEQSVSVELYSEPAGGEELVVKSGSPKNAAERLSQGLSCSLSDTCLMQCDVVSGRESVNRHSQALCNALLDNVTTLHWRSETLHKIPAENCVTPQAPDVTSSKECVTTKSLDAVHVKSAEAQTNKLSKCRLDVPPSTPEVMGEFDTQPRFPATEEFHTRRHCSLLSSLASATSSPALTRHGAANCSSPDVVSSFALNLSLSEECEESEVSATTLAMLEMADKVEARLPCDRKARLPCEELPCGDEATKKTKSGNPFTGIKKRTVVSKKGGDSCDGKGDVDLASQMKRTTLRSSAKKPKPATSPETADLVPGTPPKAKPSQRNLVFTTPRSATRRSSRRTSPLPSPFATPPSQETLNTVDVTVNELLFEHFLDEWGSQTRFSIAVACERSPDLVPKIGGRFSNAPTCQGTGLKIDGGDEDVLGVAVCWGAKDAFFVSFQEGDGGKVGSAVTNRLTLSRRLEAVRTMLESSANEKRMKVCFDFKEHYKALARACGICVRGGVEDPKVALWLLDPGAKEMNLHQMVEQHLAEDASLLEGSGGGFGTGGLALATSSPMNGRVRACVEAVLALKLMEKLRKTIEGDKLSSVFEQVEMPVLICLARMELNGFGFSETECERLKSILKAKLRTLEEQAYRLVNHPFSLTSLEDVAHVLFVELKLPPDGNTDVVVAVKKRENLGTNRRGVICGVNRKHLSTNKEVLERLKPLHSLPGVILEWRRLNCALSKVVFPLQKEKSLCAHLNMPRIHCTSQLHTATGRVSFTEPNLQNVPRDFEIDLPTVIADSPPSGAWDGLTSKRGRPRRSIAALKPRTSFEPLCQGPAYSVSMRNAFVPFVNGILFAADYSQLELRLITHLADDARLRRILNAGGDVFKMIAGEMNRISAESVSDAQRQRAKQVCYGIIYGIGARSLAEQLGVDEDEATVFIDNFKMRYSGVKKYLQETIAGCRARGYVKTITNRRRYLPAITSNNAHARAQAERQAVNTTVQGSAADLMKIAMIRIDGRLARDFPACAQTHRHKQEGKAARPRARRSRAGTQSPRGGYMVLQLHDELIFETSERDLGRVAGIVKEEMEGALELSVALPVKMKAGPTWGRMMNYEL